MHFQPFFLSKGPWNQWDCFRDSTGWKKMKKKDKFKKGVINKHLIVYQHYTINNDHWKSLPELLSFIMGNRILVPLTTHSFSMGVPPPGYCMPTRIQGSQSTWIDTIDGSQTNRPFPSSLVSLFQNESKCEPFHMKMSSAWSFIFMQIKVILIRMVSHLDSLWIRGRRKLGSGLFFNWKIRNTVYFKQG